MRDYDDLDTTWVRLRAVRRVNIWLFSMGILLGIGMGFILGFVIGGGLH